MLHIQLMSPYEKWLFLYAAQELELKKKEVLKGDFLKFKVQSFSLKLSHNKHCDLFLLE